MTVGSEGKDVLDAGANPAISTNDEVFKLESNLFYTEREWSRLVGWGIPPKCTPNSFDTGMNSFDRAKSTGTDSPKDD